MKVDLKKHERIKGHLALLGLTFSSIARDLQIKPSSVVIISQGHRRSDRIQRAIAEALGMTPEQLWPDRYAKGEARVRDRHPDGTKLASSRGSVRSVSDE